MSGQIIGGKAFLAKLAAMDAEMKRDIAKEAVKAAGEKCKELAADAAPVRSSRLEGHMAMTAPKNTPSGATVDVGPGAHEFYGLFQEKGTDKHGANPFLRPSLEDPQVVQAAREAVRKALAKF